jgi:integrase/recombinase XerD
MKSVIAERVVHKGANRIALIFPFDRELITLVKELPEARWSKTLNCWHLPDNQETLEKIVMTLGDNSTLDVSAISKLSMDFSNNEVEVISNELLQETVKSDQHSTRSLSFDEEAAGKGFKLSSSSKGIRTEVVASKTGYGPVEFTIDESDGRLIIRFTGRYDKEWIKELKSYGRAWFDQVRLEWLLGWSKMKVDSLSDYFSSKGVEVIVKKAYVPLPVKEQRQDQGTQIRDRELTVGTMTGIEIVRRYLNEKRYSKNTVETYISLLELFFKYFYDKAPVDINEEDISDFFHDFIVYHKYSASYHNQLISAIKMYYKLNESSGIDTSSLGRPRRGRALPKVFSKEEVKLILNASRNLKHRLVLWMIYSCGLRRSEVTNIRLTDLDRARGILNIREAKGMNDRIVPVSDKVWEKVDEYIASYHPEFWLFEGQTGGRYSSESVYRVFKQAVKSAGIRKDVGVHSLRHSYATHLHENGVDIRYIQELLGHKSTRTTEIYTHVSRRNLIGIRSPIDDLDLK